MGLILLIIVIIVVVLYVYFLPTVIASGRKVNLLNVFFINLFLGWTLFGWLLALALSFGRKKSPQTIIHHIYTTGEQSPTQYPPLRLIKSDKPKLKSDDS